MDSDKIFNVIGLILSMLFMLVVIISQTIRINHLYEQIKTIQIEKRACESTFDLFKNDMNKFCEEQFENMGC